MFELIKDKYANNKIIENILSILKSIIFFVIV